MRISLFDTDDFKNFELTISIQSIAELDALIALVNGGTLTRKSRSAQELMKAEIKNVLKKRGYIVK